MQIHTITELKTKVKQAKANSNRQRNKEQLYGIMSGKIRVRYTYWEQVARDYQRIINEINPNNGLEVCECGSLEYFYAPIVKVRCLNCKKPLPNIKKINSHGNTKRNTNQDK